jgi:hypothetical protein
MQMMALRAVADAQALAFLKHHASFCFTGRQKDSQ